MHVSRTQGIGSEAHHGEIFARVKGRDRLFPQTLSPTLLLVEVSLVKRFVGAIHLCGVQVYICGSLVLWCRAFVSVMLNSLVSPRHPLQ